MYPTAPSPRLLAALRACVRSQESPRICRSCRFSRRSFNYVAAANTSSGKPRWHRDAQFLPSPAAAPPRPPPQPLSPRRRRISNIAPVTAVNAQKNIPLEYKELHDALKDLESSAGVYVNLSQLQLALQGLESRDAVTRVAGGSFSLALLALPLKHSRC